MTDLSTKTVLIHDLSGGFTHIAEAIAPSFAQVLYYSFYEHGFPSVRDYLPGVGLDGVERVPDFDNALSRADLVVFTDVGRAGLQERLRREGYPVWGAGRGSQLEQDRKALKSVLKECGLPVAPWTPVTGLDTLREMLRERDDLYVKFSMFRADVETFHHESYFTSQVWLDDLGVRLGPFQNSAEFIVEEPISGHACEVGIDGFCVDGELLTPCLWGYETKDAAYLGTTTAVPTRLRAVYECLAPVMQALQYRAPFCIESRSTDDADYVIDFTARCGSPPSEAQAIAIENLPEIMYHGAHGVAVPIKWKKPIVAQLVLTSEWGEDHMLGLEIGRPDAVCIHGHCRMDGNDFAVSPARIKEFGGAVGMGDTVADAIADAFDAADSVSGYQVQYDGSAFDKALDCIREGEQLDLPWGRLDVEAAA